MLTNYKTGKFDLPFVTQILNILLKKLIFKCIFFVNK